MELRGRFPPSTRLAMGLPSLSAGENEKSVSSLFNRKPRTMTPLPKELSIVVVMESALPKRSMIETWLVPVALIAGSLPFEASTPSGTPGSALPISMSVMSAARPSR